MLYAGVAGLFLSQGFGCPTCPTDYTMVNIANTASTPNLAMCGVSSILTLASTALTNSTSTFISNCTQFRYLSSSLKSNCNQCATSFALKNDYTGCDSATGDLANCVY